MIVRRCEECGRDFVAELRSLADEVARPLEGVAMSREALFEIGSIVGTLRARRQYYAPVKTA